MVEFGENLFSKVNEKEKANAKIHSTIHSSDDNHVFYESWKDRRWGGVTHALKGSGFLRGAPVGRTRQRAARVSLSPASLFLSLSSSSAPQIKQQEKNLPLVFQKNFLSWALSPQTVAGPPAPLDDLALRNSLTHYKRENPSCAVWQVKARAFPRAHATDVSGPGAGGTLPTGGGRKRNRRRARLGAHGPHSLPGARPR